MPDDAFGIDHRNGANARQRGTRRGKQRRPLCIARRRSANARARHSELPQRGVAGGERTCQVFGNNDRKGRGALLGIGEPLLARPPEIGRAQRRDDQQHADRKDGDPAFAHAKSIKAPSTRFARSGQAQFRLR
jgi:hypothetical protein